jgi:hypothetical protein
VKTARVVATADNTFTLYINGTKVLSGANWESAESTNLTDVLARRGDLAVQADNIAPGAAGMRLCTGDLVRGTKGPMVIDTGTGWRSSAERAGELGEAGFDDSAWTPQSRSVPTVCHGACARFHADGGTAARARCFVQNDALQNVMGRPIRDQIIMERPSQPPPPGADA